VTSTGNAGCFKKGFTTLKAYINVFRRHVQVLNCQNVAKHTEFYLGQLRFNVTSTGNAGCLKKGLYNFESLYKFIQRKMYSVLKCHDVAKHTEFYLG
jgi:hypothetical protein